MRSSSISMSTVPIKDIQHHFKDTLIQFFYVLGIEPINLDISEFTNEKKFLLNDFKEVQLITKFPSSGRIQSDIDPTILMCHCFPEGYHFIEAGKQPEDEFLYFSLNNLLSLSNSDKILYFVCAIIYEPLSSYMNIKYKNKVPEIKEESVKFRRIYAPKALCLSSFCSFPTELKTLLNELLRYIRNNKITMPIELILENIVYGIPRPLRMCLCVFCNKSDNLIPGQTKNIEFNLSFINQYNLRSFNCQQVFSLLSSHQIMIITYAILTEIPVLFFGKDKEKLTNTIEVFLSLIYPFEYQCPVIPILPDCMSGLIELEKSFIFGINKSFNYIVDNNNNNKKNKSNNQKIKYFSDMHLNVHKRIFLIIDIDKIYVNAFCGELENYHLINFDDLGNYQNNNNDDDRSHELSKDAFTEKVNDMQKDHLQFPVKYAYKIVNKIDAFKKEKEKEKEKEKNINNEYSPQTNSKIGKDIFYYFFASIFLNYNNYLYNNKEEVNKIYNNLKSKKYEEINIKDLFNVDKFIQDYKENLDFYPKFFETKIFKNFIIRKYLNDPLDRYRFLVFDEQILEKRNKGVFKKVKAKVEFSNNEIFQLNIPYSVKPYKKGFSEQELSYIKNNRDKLLIEYYQSIGDDNKLNYTIFPKLIYDDKFFKKKFNSDIDFSKNQHLIKILQKYHELEDLLVTEKSKDFFSIYKSDFVNRHIIDINTFQYNNQLLIALQQLWLIVFALSFYYIEENEKIYRFEDLIRFLPNVIDNDKTIISILLLAIKNYGNEEMMIKVFELIKSFNYTHYAYLISKFKAKKNLKWDIKKIDIANEKISIIYYRDPIVYDRQTTELIDNAEKRYKNRPFRKRTFYTGKEKIIIQSEKENVEFDICIVCPHCKNKSAITDYISNLASKKKDKMFHCGKCQKKMEPLCHANYGKENIEFKLYSVLDLLKIAKELVKEYGTKIDLDELREKYKDFFWNCILYFNFNSLNYEILLKYRSTIPQLNRTFKVLEICKQ